MKQLILAIAVGVLLIQACATPAQVSAPGVEENDLDSRTYCRNLSKVKGGDYQVEESCLIDEYQAQQDIKSMQIPLDTEKKCKKIALDAGGSYQVMKNCIQKEMKDKSK